MTSTGHSADGGTEQPPPGARPAAGHRMTWWLVGVVTFVVGLLIGGVLVALAGFGQGSAGGSKAISTPSSAAAGTPTPTQSSSDAGASVQLNTACLRAVNDAQAVARALSGLGTAVSNVDAGALDRIVQQENRLQLRLQADIKACNATVRLPDGSLSATPVVSPSPS